MSEYILDTDMLTLLEDGHPAVSERFFREKAENVAITVLSVEEQMSGWYTQLRKAKRPERLAWAYRRLTDTVRFFSRLQILTYDEAAMRRYEQLRKRKIKIGRMDLRIAVTALEHGAVLVTRNAHDFKQVPGLRIEDWSQ
jgi:tRNA(fMet)-specific endonuclease VapC